MASAPVENKVRAATGVGLALGLIITVLNAVGTNSALLGSTPPWIQSIVTLLAPPLAVLLAGWVAPHSPRPAVAPDPVPVAPAPTAVVAPPVAAPAPVAPVVTDPTAPASGA